MDQDTPIPTDELATWIAEHWAPQPGDPDVFLKGLATRRRRRRVRNDRLGIVALAAAALLFVGSARAPTSVPDHGWLAATSLAEPASPALSTDLAILRTTFLADETSP